MAALDGFLKALEKTAQKYRTFLRLHNEYREHDAFSAQLDAEIERIKRYRALQRNRRDLIAAVAVQCALSYLCPEWYHTPKKQWPPVTAGKPWHLISTLLYEAVTGQADRDHVLNYMSQLKKSKEPGKILRVMLLPRV